MPWDFWLIFVVLGVLIPWRGRVRLRNLLAKSSVGAREKLILYASTIAYQWILTSVVAWRAFARGLTATELGFARQPASDLLMVSLAGALLVGTFQWFNLRRIGTSGGPVPEFMRKLGERIFPSAPVELVPYVALAVTAGVCEEFLYRGFAMAALARTGLVPWAVVVVSSVLFGLAHTYQGRSGVFGTMLMGLLFGAVRLGFQSLLPVVVWHSTVDLIAGIAGPRYLMPVKAPQEQI